MNIVCICLARKNSKRIPNKNFKLFNGKPLIHYTAELMNKLEYKTYIYTDDNNIKNYINNNFKSIEVKEKPERYAQDNHLTDEELLFYNQTLNADIIVLLQATSPFRNIDDLNNAIKDFINKDADCGITVKKLDNKYYYFNDKCNYDKNERSYNGCNKDFVYKETGSFYIFKKDQLLKNHITNGKLIFFDDPYDIDIDTLSDFNNAKEIK
jgi:N-acylneuraminate cytidylyltransferase